MGHAAPTAEEHAGTTAIQGTSDVKDRSYRLVAADSRKHVERLSHGLLLWKRLV